jgi:4-hydroxy-tetrahydrodipicolinate synthase
MSLGGKGCISVLSNLLPAESSAMCKKFDNGDVKGACADQLKYLNLINALFSEVNPIPVKAAMAKMGFCEDYLRLPLTPMEDENREKLFAEMRNVGIEI